MPRNEPSTDLSATPWSSARARPPGAAHPLPQQVLLGAAAILLMAFAGSLLSLLFFDGRDPVVTEAGAPDLSAAAPPASDEATIAPSPEPGGATEEAAAEDAEGDTEQPTAEEEAAEEDAEDEAGEGEPTPQAGPARPRPRRRRVRRRARQGRGSSNLFDIPPSRRQ